MSEPRVTVIPRVRFRGWDGSVPIQVAEGAVMTLSDALAKWYPSDACILAYAPSDLTATTCPRHNKTAQIFYELENIEPPRLEAVLVDIDYEDHAEPPDGWSDELVARSPWPCGWYRTPGGMRLLYIPREPVPVNLADSYIAQLHVQLDAAGIPTDKSTRDWTRLFKAPHALGRDLPFDYSALAPIEWHPETLDEADPTQLGDIIYRDFKTARDTVPDDHTWEDLKPLGRNSKLAAAIHKNNFAAPVGQRHSALLSAVRTIVEKYDTVDPMVPFHLLLTSVRAMREKTDHELWRICEWMVALYAGSKAAREEARTVAEDDALEDLGLSSTVDLYQRLIVDTGSEFYVWDEERGEYSTGYTKQHQLIGALSRHCPTLADGYYDGKASIAVIMRDLSTVANEVVFSYLDGKVGYDKVSYTFYQRICKPDRSLAPKFDADVNEWMIALGGGGEQAARFLDWVASVPRLDRPTCACYLRGPNSIGKGMFTAGLARIWSAESTTTPYAQLIETFNGTLKKSPIIVADERIPQDAFSDNDSSIFRRIIGNDGILIRDLNRTHATLVGYPRVLITANNDDALAIREDLSPDDIAAIQVRIGFIDSTCSDEDEHPAVKFLAEYAERVGATNIREATESWVAGGRIAKHVLWLAENRGVNWGDRFLVEGWDSKLTRSLATAAGSTGAVAEIIAQIMDERDQSMPLEAIRWFGGKVYVNNAGLGREWANRVRTNGLDKPPRSTSRLKALKALSREEQARLDSPDSTDGNRRQLSYWSIDAAVIARLAEERGICPGSEIINQAARKAEPIGAAQRVYIGGMGKQ